jgi:hypothetical protein
MEQSVLREHVGKPLNKLLMALILSLLPFQALPNRQKNALLDFSLIGHCYKLGEH